MGTEISIWLEVRGLGYVLERGPKRTFGGYENVLYIDWAASDMVDASVKTCPTVPLQVTYLVVCTLSLNRLV